MFGVCAFVSVFLSVCCAHAASVARLQHVCVLVVVLVCVISIVVTVLQSLCLCPPLPVPVPVLMFDCYLCVLCCAVGVLLVLCCAVLCLLFCQLNPSEPVWDRFLPEASFARVSDVQMISTPPWRLDEGSSQCNRGRWETCPRRLFGIYFFGLDDFPPQILSFPFASHVQFPKAADLHIAPKNSGAFLWFGNVQVQEKKDNAWKLKVGNTESKQHWREPLDN